MLVMASADRHDQISSLLEVEAETISLMRELLSNTEMTADEAALRFTNIHAHAAWTDLAPLASLAERVWAELDTYEQRAKLNDDQRNAVHKNLMTYKFLLHRQMSHYDAEIKEAMAS